MSARVTIGIPTYNRPALLKEAIASALAQSYDDIRVLVSDNASSRETRAVVELFDDPRLEYIRSDKNVGMIGNFSRLISLADSELLMLLPDDDYLYNTYLELVVAMFDHHPTVGMVHTGYEEVDIDSRPKGIAMNAVVGRNHPELESGEDFIERSMTSAAVCFSSVTYRAVALRDAGGLVADEEPFADIPLFLRIALHWDVGYVAAPLVGFRTHPDTETSRLAAPDDIEMDSRERERTYTRIFLDRRLGFLASAPLPAGTLRRYRALAIIRFLIDRGGLGTSWSDTTRGFLDVVRQYPPILVEPLALHLVAAQLGGRWARRAVNRLRSRPASSDTRPPGSEG